MRLLIHCLQRKLLTVLTKALASAHDDRGSANTSSSTSSGNVSLMMEGGEKSKLESPARDLLCNNCTKTQFVKTLSYLFHIQKTICKEDYYL